MITTALSYDEKVQLLTHLGKIYRRGTLCRDFIRHGVVMESEGSYADMELASKMQIILDHMEVKNADIIRNDFMDLKDVRWYESLYSEERYRQMKSEAMTQFLDCLYV